MVELRDSGRATTVGVSNFQPDHLDRIIDETGVVPAVNQVEVHPYFGNEAVRAANARHGVATEAWSPIAQGEVLGDTTIEKVAARLGRTPSQVTLRWHLQRGDIVFPKSNRPERMRENFAIFDFELTDDDLAAISALDRGEAGPHRRQPGHDGLDPVLTASSPGGRPSTRRARRDRLVPWRRPRCPRPPSCSSGRRVT